MNRMNESKDNGQLQNKHASSKPKESEKGDACTLGCCFFERDVSRIGQRGSGVGDGPPLSPQRTPPSASASVALEHHGSSSSYLVRSHDALELSFRSERSQLPGLALCCLRRRQRNRKHRKYCPQDRKPTWEMSSPKRISLPPWEPRGFLQRRDRSPNECTSGAFFECKGTHYDRWQNC